MEVPPLRSVREEPLAGEGGGGIPTELILVTAAYRWTLCQTLHALRVDTPLGLCGWPHYPLCAQGQGHRASKGPVRV